MTDDHSLVAELVRRGELSPAEAEVHPQRSVITRALGTDAKVDVDAFLVEGRPGDVFLLCSDGLSTMVDHQTIAELVNRSRTDLAAATGALINAANNVGGEDNITAVLFELVTTDETGTPAVEEPTTETQPAASEEEDTLHPEDRVALPPGPWFQAAEGDTMVASPAEIQNALAAPMEVVPLGRLFLATLLIIALVALIIALALWGLAR